MSAPSGPGDGRGVLDTSVLIAEEEGRPRGNLPERGAISIITIAELHLGVLMADDSDVRARRLRTLTTVERHFDPLPIDATVARTFAELVSQTRRAGRRPKIMDTWIAATAVRHDLPVYTQDEDFASIPRVRVVRV